ncbi:MAG: hypothetical protein H0U64_01985 [Gemmatimonadaceae bacterium]|nr:hypothetical protein [Gemmatimonadaceae bacterium]
MMTRRMDFLLGPLALLLTISHTSIGQSTRARDANRLPGHLVEVTAAEFFLRAPDTIPSGLTTFQLIQAGLVADRVRDGVTGQAAVADKGDNTRGMHMLWVVRLDSGKSIADLHRAEEAGETPRWVRHMGGPGFMRPPGSTNATMLLEPGNYALVCYVGSARANRARYHLLHGMFRALTVIPARSNSAALPTPDVVVRVTAGNVLSFSKPLRAGRLVIHVQNETDSHIEFKAVRVPDGMSGKQFMAQSGDVEGASSPGGLSNVPPQSWVMTTLDFIAGEHIIGTRPSLRHPSSQIVTVGPR